MASPRAWLLVLITALSFALCAGVTGVILRCHQAPGRSQPTASGADPVPSAVQLHESQVASLLAKPAVDLQDVRAVFGHVFAALPAEVMVYPTENYYYWSFWAGGQQIRGNIRFDPAYRDRGQVSFAYYAAMHRPVRPEEMDHFGRDRIMGEDDGVSVRRLGPLLYEVEYSQRLVRFRLHDVPQGAPSPARLGPSEVFVFRTFDESGFQLELVYDTAARQFAFLLDESAPLPDELVDIAPGLALGRLTGFAFYRDPSRLRRVLVGVDAELIKENTYYDGPFDQLADNFIRGDTFRHYAEEAYPYTRGRLNERGVFMTFGAVREESGSRLALTPYFQYPDRDELLAFVARCKAARVPDEAILCMTDDYKRYVPGPESK